MCVLVCWGHWVGVGVGGVRYLLSPPTLAHSPTPPRPVEASGSFSPRLTLPFLIVCDDSKAGSTGMRTSMEAALCLASALPTAVITSTSTPSTSSQAGGGSGVGGASGARAAGGTPTSRRGPGAASGSGVSTGTPSGSRRAGRK